MNLSTAVFAVLLTSLAVSYGWGMRGTVIGGEKGALLPGAIMGLLAAWFAGGVFKDYFWIITAVGALTMYHGGTETYGQTMSFILYRRGKPDAAKSFRLGAAGVFLKGALWFGICGAGLGMIFPAMTGKVYKISDIVILFAGIPLIQALGVKIFNKPYNPEKKIFPKIYFSENRREEWGGNLLLLIEMVIFMLVRGDGFALSMTAAGVLAGGIGFTGGLLAYDYTEHPKKNGKYFFGSWQTKGYISGWKLMEFFFGAVGGLGLMFCLCINYEKIAAFNDIIKANGGIFSPLGEKYEFLAWILLSLFSLTLFQYVLIHKKQKGFFDEGTGSFDTHALELIERPFYSAFPLVLIFLGNITMAQLSSFFIVYWVLAEKEIFERTDKVKHRAAVCVLLAISTAAALAGQIVFGGYTPLACWLMYLVPYLLYNWIWLLGKHKRENGKFLIKNNGALPSYGGCVSVELNFLIQLILLIIAGMFIFKQ